MGGEIVGGAFAASIKPLIQHGRASSEYFGEHHLWPSHLQADLAATCQRDANLGTGGGQQPWQIRCQSSQACYCPGHVPQSFRGCFDTSSGTERPSLVKLPIKESVVKLLPSASSLRSSYYLTHFAQSSFIKRLRLTWRVKPTINYALNREVRLTTSAYGTIWLAVSSVKYLNGLI